MRIIVDRFHSTNDATLSVISVNGQFECFGLEDEYREDKVASETRIPAGEYQVSIRNYGGLNLKYKSRFSSVHQGMLEIHDVPGFTDILIHCGNSADDTSGCLLVGQGATTSGNTRVVSSTGAYLALYNKVLESAQDGKLIITFIDNDMNVIEYP